MQRESSGAGILSDITADFREDVQEIFTTTLRPEVCSWVFHWGGPCTPEARFREWLNAASSDSGAFFVGTVWEHEVLRSIHGGLPLDMASAENDYHFFIFFWDIHDIHIYTLLLRFEPGSTRWTWITRSLRLSKSMDGQVLHLGDSP